MGFRSVSPTASKELGSRLDTALQFMQVSAPARVLNPSDYEGMKFADLGLDPPDHVISMATIDSSAIVDFGALNPAGTSQYVRVVGHPTLYLMPRFVGSEWQIAADMAKRMSPSETGLEGDGKGRGLAMLLPVSVDRLGAIELVTGAKLYRFERDIAGNWFLHVGQHVHSASIPAHVADPEQARAIADILTPFDRVQIENVIARHPRPEELDRYGLSRPALVLLAYERDSSTPIARVDFGTRADDRFSRYARVSLDGDVFTIASYQADRLLDLLKAVGAGS